MKYKNHILWHTIKNIIYKSQIDRIFYIIISNLFICWMINWIRNMYLEFLTHIICLFIWFFFMNMIFDAKLLLLNLIGVFMDGKLHPGFSSWCLKLIMRNFIKNEISSTLSETCIILRNRFYLRANVWDPKLI